MKTGLKEFFADGKQTSLLIAGFGLLLAAGLVSFVVYSITSENAQENEDNMESSELAEKDNSMLYLGNASLTASSMSTAGGNPQSSTDTDNEVPGSVETNDADEWETFTATAYTAHCEGCSGVTRTGVDLRENPDADVIAVDPDVIPLGTRVKVKGHGEFLAADTGGAIKGEKIDIFMPNRENALAFGRQSVEIRIVEE